MTEFAKEVVELERRAALCGWSLAVRRYNVEWLIRKYFRG